MPPVKPAPWTGTRDALAYGPTAPQTRDGSERRRERPPQSEDCLVLNVFTPASATDASGRDGVAARRRFLERLRLRPRSWTAPAWRRRTMSSWSPSITG